MKVYVDAWIYVTEKFVNMGNIELYEGVLRYEKVDYPPIPSFIYIYLLYFLFTGFLLYTALTAAPFSQNPSCASAGQRSSQLSYGAILRAPN